MFYRKKIFIPQNYNISAKPYSFSQKVIVLCAFAIAKNQSSKIPKIFRLGYAE
jgi:hypothetical protein